MQLQRIQIDFPEEQIKALERIMEEIKVRTKKDLFNNALTLLEWAIRERKAGRTIASIDETTHKVKELIMPALLNVTPTKADDRLTLTAH